MRYIILKLDEKQDLEHHYTTHSKHYFRQRCHALLLSNDGTSVPEIAKVLKVQTRTIYRWMNKWQKNGVAGLSIKIGSGRKPLLSITDEATVDLIKKKPKRMLVASKKCVKN